MKYPIRGLLTLLISLFILNSCKNPVGVGLDNPPGSSFLGTLNDTVTLHTVTLLDDSALSVSRDANSNTNIPGINVLQIPFGYHKDNALGETHANIALTISVPDSGDARLPEQAQIDSAVLVLRYGNSFVGDSVSSTFHVKLKQLNESFNPSSIYYTTKAWDVKPEELGNVQIHKFRLSDSVSVTISGSTGQDSVIKVAPQLRMQLDKTFIAELLNAGQDSATLNTASSFREYIKGFYLTADKESHQGKGGLATFAAYDGNNANSTNPGYLEVTYRIRNSAGTDDSTLIKRYPIPASSTSQSYMSSGIKRTFSPEIQNQLDHPQLNQTTVYAQAMGGLRTRIAFPYIDQLKGKKIAVNRAELVVYVDEEHMDSHSSPAPRLTLYRKDIAGRNQPVPDGDARSSPDPRSQFYSAGPYALGGFYDTKNKRYIFTLTTYIQDVIMGKIQHPEVYLAPVSEINLNTIPYWPDINSPASVVLKGYNEEDAQAKKEIRTKLNIYYTEVQ